MKASDAKILVSKHKQLKETLQSELKTIYSEIHSNAVEGMSAWHYNRGWLDSKNADSKYLEKSIISELKSNGYVVEEHYNNPNKPFLLISWLS